MSISTRVIQCFVPLALAVAAVATTAAQAGSDPEARDAALRAAHWQHEDALYGARQQTSPVQSVPLLWEAHWRHEDALYRARNLSSSQQQSAAVAGSSGEGVDRRFVLTAAVVLAALIFGAAATGIRRNLRRLASS
jgi:hypothetical protein